MIESQNLYPVCVQQIPHMLWLRYNYELWQIIGAVFTLQSWALSWLIVNKSSGGDWSKPEILKKNESFTVTISECFYPCNLIFNRTIFRHSCITPTISSDLLDPIQPKTSGLIVYETTLQSDVIFWPWWQRKCSSVSIQGLITSAVGL